VTLRALREIKEKRSGSHGGAEGAEIFLSAQRLINFRFLSVTLRALREIKEKRSGSHRGAEGAEINFSAFLCDLSGLCERLKMSDVNL
jgi:hypothetical protein